MLYECKDRDQIETDLEALEDIARDFLDVLENWDNDGDEMRDFEPDIYRIYKKDTEFKFELIELAHDCFIYDKIGHTTERYNTARERLLKDIETLKQLLENC